MRILVFNCGSSSLKFELIEIGQSSADQNNAPRLARGIFEEIGSRSIVKTTDRDGHTVERSEAIPDHRAAAVRALDWLVHPGTSEIDAVAHRIVHGGEQITEAARVTDAIIGALDEASQFAPLHNPPALSVLRAV